MIVSYDGNRSIVQATVPKLSKLSFQKKSVIIRNAIMSIVITLNVVAPYCSSDLVVQYFWG